MQSPTTPRAGDAMGTVDAMAARQHRDRWSRTRSALASRWETLTSPEPATLVLLAAVAAGVVGYGGYGGTGLPMAVLLLVAGVLALPVLVARARQARREVALAAAALGGLGGWGLLRAALAGDATAGLPMLGLAGALVLALALVHLTGTDGRDRIVQVLLALGALTALAGWVGVVWRVWPLVLADQGMWRASGTIGYPNALAGLVVPLTLAALARLASTAPRAWWVRAGDAAVACLLVLGSLAALSRGGAVGAAVGGVVLLALVGPRRLLLGTWPVLLGGLVAAVGLLPSIREGEPADPVTAVAALVAGLGVAAVGSHWRGAPGSVEPDAIAPGSPGTGAAERGPVEAGPVEAGSAEPAATLRSSVARAAAVAGGLVALAGSLALAAAGPLRPSIAVVVDGRATLSSSWRVEQHVAAWRALSEQPLLGTGPGRAALEWTDGGRTLVARYVHDEYMQVVTELGAVGAVLLLAVLSALVAVLVAARHPATGQRPVWAGAAAATAAFAMHSGFDFLWHVPVLPVVVAVLVAAGSRRARARPGRDEPAAMPDEPAKAELPTQAPGPDSRPGQLVDAFRP